MDLMDCCGTGGSGLPHYNTSTTVAFVLAAAGIKTIKFGNRAASSQSGSFDFLEALGVPFGLPLEKLIEITEFSGLAFLFAPQVYPALAKFQALRKSVGRRTVFNFLGPLLNPLRPAYRLTGVSDAKMQRQMASYLAEHPVNRTQAWLVRSEDGLDEFSLKAPNLYLSVRGNQIQEHSWVDPPAQSGPALTFSCPSENVRYFHALVCGEDTRSEVYRMVCLNAAAGLVVAGQADSIATGREIVVDLLAKGAVRETFARCRRAYEQAAG
jgi:anthranilate phosphoribosyltransferase